MQTVTNFTVDATKQVAVASKPPGSNNYVASVYIGGDFGSGTVTLLASPDGGTTKIPLLDANGAAVSVTSATLVLVQLGGGSISPAGAQTVPELIYATLTGSSSPALVITINDNWVPL